MKLKPGSLLAYRAGCSCNIVDNHGGLGLYGDGSRYGFSINTACPMHGREVRANLIDGYRAQLPEPKAPDPRRPAARRSDWRPWMGSLARWEKEGR